MSFFLDSTVIVDIDRREQETIRLLETLTKEGERLLLSTISVAEIFTGTYLRKDFKAAALEGKRLLGQFVWVEFDGEIAEKTGQLVALLLAQGSPVSFQDVGIAASFLCSDAAHLVTKNTKDFSRIPGLAKKILTPHEALLLLKGRAH